jgi:hypothetical protein
LVICGLVTGNSSGTHYAEQGFAQLIKSEKAKPMRKDQMENGPVSTHPSVSALGVEWQVDEATPVEIRNATKVALPQLGTPERPDRWPYLRFSDSSLTA